MKRTALSFFCLFLCLLLLLPMTVSCTERSSPLTSNGIRSVTLNARGKLEIPVTMNSHLLEEHKGQKLCLYELLPGEQLADLATKTPVAEKKVSASVQFRLPLEENGTTRLYSSFVVAFSDGTLLASTPVSVGNPEFLATDTARYPDFGSPKGLTVENAAPDPSLGATHALLSVRLSELLGGSDVLSFGTKEFSYSALRLEQLDREVRAANEAGMTVSLGLTVDAIPSFEALTALLDLLAARYVKDSSFGRVVAWMLLFDGSLEATDTASVVRLSTLSLRSRYANARVYAVAALESLSATLSFFTELHKSLSAKGSMEWCAGVAPLPSTDPWTVTNDDRMTVDKLPEVLKFLSSSELKNRPARLAVCGLRFAAVDEEKQAAALAYSYRLALANGAHTVFYGAQNDDVYGLLDGEGNRRRAADLFTDQDLGLSAEDVALCDRFSGGAFSTLPATVSRRELSGSAANGNDGMEITPLFDFSKNDTHGFTAVGGWSTPECKESVSLGYPVLYTWLAHEKGQAQGVRTVLENGRALEDAFSVSARFLLQNRTAETSDVTLVLEGVTKNGTRLSWSATTKVSNGSWQTATFYISNFAAEADLSQPCTLTLLTSAEEEGEEGEELRYLLWLDTLGLRYPKANPTASLFLPILGGGLLLGLVLTLSTYFLSVSRKRRRARAARYRK